MLANKSPDASASVCPLVFPRARTSESTDWPAAEGKEALGPGVDAPQGSRTEQAGSVLENQKRLLPAGYFLVGWIAALLPQSGVS